MLIRNFFRIVAIATCSSTAHAGCGGELLEFANEMLEKADTLHQGLEVAQFGQQQMSQYTAPVTAVQNLTNQSLGALIAANPPTNFPNIRNMPQ